LVSDEEFLDQRGKTIRKAIFDNLVEEPIELQDNMDEQSTNINHVPIPPIHTIINKPLQVPITNMDHQDGEDKHNEECQEEGEGPRHNGNLFGGNNQEGKEEFTFGFPILDVTRDINMKNIMMASLPLFYDKSSEDPDAFLF